MLHVLIRWGAQALKFGRGNKSIVGMISSEKETFDFRTAVPIEGAVENWMTAVEAEMRRTLYQITKEGVFFYAKTPRCVLHWVGAAPWSPCTGLACLDVWEHGGMSRVPLPCYIRARAGPSGSGTTWAW